LWDGRYWWTATTSIARKKKKALSRKKRFSLSLFLSLSLSLSLARSLARPPLFHLIRYVHRLYLGVAVATLRERIDRPMTLSHKIGNGRAGAVSAWDEGTRARWQTRDGPVRPSVSRVTRGFPTLITILATVGERRTERRSVIRPSPATTRIPESRRVAIRINTRVRPIE